MNNSDKTLELKGNIPLQALIDKQNCQRISPYTAEIFKAKTLLLHTLLAKSSLPVTGEGTIPLTFKLTAPLALTMRHRILCCAVFADPLAGDDNINRGWGNRGVCRGFACLGIDCAYRRATEISTPFALAVVCVVCGAASCTEPLVGRVTLRFLRMLCMGVVQLVQGNDSFKVTLQFGNFVGKGQVGFACNQRIAKTA
jgi:hypothetical protein